MRQDDWLGTYLSIGLVAIRPNTLELLRRIETRARSSVAERPAHNRLVIGSNPVGPTIWLLNGWHNAHGVFSMVMNT